MAENGFWKGMSPRAVSIAQNFLAEVLEQGDTAIDATAGNGHDTLFLAALVGDRGKVYSFDVQKEAMEVTSTRLQEAGLRHRAVLYICGHENMEKILIDDCGRPGCKAAIFNLGFLPGSSSEIKTTPGTTAAGINQALSLLPAGGRLSVVAYRGHAGAMEESREVDRLFAALNVKHYWVARITFPNCGDHSPYVILAQKTAGV